MTSREMFSHVIHCSYKIPVCLFSQTHKCSCCLKIFYKTFQQYSKLLISHAFSFCFQLSVIKKIVVEVEWVEW